MSEKICRLCLQTISNNNYRTIGESMLKTLKLNLNISEESVMCIECANCLRIFSIFTSGFDLKNGVRLDPVKLEDTTNLKSLMETDIKCSFCTEARGGEDLISLNDSKENKFMVNMLEKYVSETNLKKPGELLACGTCHEALQGVLSIILKCLKVEEKISKYIELKGTDDKGQIELKEVQEFMLRPILKLETESVGVNELEGRCDKIKEEYSTMVEEEIKYEKEISSSELIIKTKDTDIKYEQSECNGFQETFIEYHKRTSELKMFKCDLCSYEAKQKSNLNSHLLTHKSLFEIKGFKCGICSYKAKHKQNLARHLLTHKSPSEIKMFKCELCPYETKHQHDLKKHLLTHESSSQIKMFKCELCAFETKRKHYLKSHLLIHKSPSEIEMFKCELCLYETKRKSNLKMHLLTHKSPSEIKMFKCAMCPYETKHKNQLRSHLWLLHKELRNKYVPV